MTFFDIARLADDADFQRRVAACRVGEVPNVDPWQWVNNNRWAMAGQPGFGDAYGYAILNDNPNPGSDDTVITDAMILSAVQALMAAELPPEPVQATGATAGIPGIWTPSGSVPPATAAEAAGIVASPDTPWTTGQFMQGSTDGAPGRMTWSGIHWVGGVAP
jgi:hypothetical protein